MGEWKIDTDHTAAEFSVRHMMITTVRGNLKNVTGTLIFDPDVPEESRVEAAIDTTTIHTGTAERDAHLRSADFLWVDHYPTLYFRSTSVVPGATRSRAKVNGELTIRDVTRPVMLDVEFLGEDISPWGDRRIGFTATAYINREDFGLTWNQKLASGNWLVDREVKITLDVQAVMVTEAMSEPASG